MSRHFSVTWTSCLMDIPLQRNVSYNMESDYVILVLVCTLGAHEDYSGDSRALHTYIALIHCTSEDQTYKIVKLQ